jgi:hypothetical protein
MRLWIALGTRAAQELAFFARTVERLDPSSAFEVFCLDTDRPPEVLCDARGQPDPSRFIALSGFAPRRFAEEQLEADAASIAWLSPEAFDLLPREYTHESPTRTRVLGRLAYERCRASIRARLNNCPQVQVGIALDAGGGLSGAILPLLEDLSGLPGRVIDVVLAIGAASPQTYATLRELERAAALESRLTRAHLVRAEAAGAPYTAVLELIQGTDSFEAPRTAAGEVDRESARGRLFEATRHTRELDAEARAPKLFFLHGVKELAFPMELLERACIARYERELIAEALAGDPRKTGRAGAALPRTLLATAEKAGFAPIEAELSARAKKMREDVLAPMFASAPDAREVKEGKLAEKLTAFHTKLESLARELEESARAPIEASMPAVRAALVITPYLAEQISIPTIADAAKSAVDLARNTARSLEGGRKDAFGAEVAERLFLKLGDKNGRLRQAAEAAASFLGAEKKIAAVFSTLRTEALLLAEQRLAGAIDRAKADFYRHASTSDVRSIDVSPFESYARSTQRLRELHVAALLTQLDYAAMKREPPSFADTKTTRFFVPDARTLSEVERLAEMREIFSGVLPAYDELSAVLAALAVEQQLTLEEESNSGDPARFVAEVKRAIRARAKRVFSPKILPHLSAYLGRMRAEARAERSALLRFEVPFQVRAEVLDPSLDRPDALAIGGAAVADSSPLEVRDLHGWTGLAWDRVTVDRAWCAVPMFAIAEIEAMRPAYMEALRTQALHPDVILWTAARTDSWSLGQSKLPTSRALADAAKGMIAPPILEEQLEVHGPDVVAIRGVVEKAVVLEEPADDLADEPTLSMRAPAILPHPEAIRTFAYARALTRALDDPDLGPRLTARLPLHRARFTERTHAALIEMERIPGEGWHVFAIQLRERDAQTYELTDRVSLGRYDLAANVLAYSAQPELVRAHAAFLERANLDPELSSEMNARLKKRIEEQRAQKPAMKEVERDLYSRLLEALTSRL